MFTDSSPTSKRSVGERGSFYAYKLNIDRFMWENVKFEYELKGEFSK
jgi:hypothetical protein